MTFKEKLLTSRPPIEAAGRQLKRYHVTSAAAPVTADTERAAAELLPKLAPDADGTPSARSVDRPRIGCVWELTGRAHVRTAVPLALEDPQPLDLEVSGGADVRGRCAHAVGGALWQLPSPKTIPAGRGSGWGARTSPAGPVALPSAAAAAPAG